MTVKKSADSVSTTVFFSNKSKVLDSPMGMSISGAELVNGSVLLDGSIVAEPVAGIAKILKSVKALVGSTTTSVICKTEGNQFKVGDIVGSKVAGIAYDITVIASDAGTGLDTMTISAAIDAPLDNGEFIYLMDAEAAANTSALKYTPYGITGTNTLIDNTTNTDVDVWVIAGVKAGSIGQELLDALLSNNKMIVEV